MAGCRTCGGAKPFTPLIKATPVKPGTTVVKTGTTKVVTHQATPTTK